MPRIVSLCDETKELKDTKLKSVELKLNFLISPGPLVGVASVEFREAAQAEQAQAAFLNYGIYSIFRSTKNKNKLFMQGEGLESIENALAILIAEFLPESMKESVLKRGRAWLVDQDDDRQAVVFSIQRLAEFRRSVARLSRSSPGAKAVQPKQNDKADEKTDEKCGVESGRNPNSKQGLCNCRAKVPMPWEKVDPPGDDPDGFGIPHLDPRDLQDLQTICDRPVPNVPSNNDIWDK